MTRPDEAWKSQALAATYLEGVRGGVPMAAEQLDIMLRVIEACGAPLARFIDLGCGSGVLAAAVLARHSGAEATLVDFSLPMLDAARRRLSGIPSIRFVEADFGTPGWTAAVADRAPFDAIVSGYAIHHQPDQRKRELYAEILALLRPGGVFVNVEHVASPTPWVRALSDEVFIDSLWTYHTSRGTGRSRQQVAEEFYHRPDKQANILTAVETQCAWLRESGFVDVDCYFKVVELAVFGGRRPGA